MADFVHTSSIIGGTPLGSLDMLPVYIKKKLLLIAEKKIVFHQLADKEDLPQGSGKTARWVRYERIGLPFLPITEGITPTITRQQPISVVEAIVDQWGDIMAITDVAELTVYHKSLQIMIERMATQASETVDRELQRVLLGGTNVTFTDPTITDRTAIGASDVMNTDTLRRALAALRDFGAPDFNGDFVGVFDPHVEMDLIKDPTFQTAASYGSQTPLFNAEIGKWMGVRWMRSNFIPTINRDTAVNGTNTSPAAAGAETALAAATDVEVVGLDVHGFETHIGTVDVVAFTTGDVVEVILPALPTGVYAYNIYAGPHSTGVLTLQAEALAPGTYHITTNGIGNTGSIGILYSTTGRVAPLVPAASVGIHQTYILGREAFGSLELTNIQTMLTPNTPSDSDPMQQRRKASWKVMFKGVVKNSNFFTRVESASAF